MKVLDLFSGIGGFSLGLGRAGMETVQFCEIDNYCQKVLAKHWPGIPIHDDIRTLDGEQFRGAVGVVCGGFPCQPFSSAGKRAGKNDDRDLWPEMYRIIREVQPAWVVGENVAGFVDMELDRTLSDLENSGYACQTFEIPACAVAAHHQRMRVWIVAQRTDADPGGAGERDTGERIVADANSERLRKQQEPELRGSRAPESVIDGEKQLVADPKGERHREAGADFQRSEKRPAGSGSAQNKVDVANAERSPPAQNST